MYSFDEINNIYTIDPDTRYFLKFGKDSVVSDSLYANYLCTVEYDLFHIFRYARSVKCNENGCECRFEIPKTGCYRSKKDVNPFLVTP